MKSYYFYLKIILFILFLNFTTIVKPQIKGFSCGDSIIDARDNQKYATVKIGTQCWMAQNLNIGVMIGGNEDQLNNGKIEKYCYNDYKNYCDNYGGLYQWDELMNYNTTERIQGICPNGWHIPSDKEFFILENFVDPSINDTNATGLRGIDAGIKLQYGGSSGFDAILGGHRFPDESFTFYGQGGYIWTSSESSSSLGWYRRFNNGAGTVYRLNDADKRDGLNVRCIGDIGLGITNIIKDNVNAIKLFPNPSKEFSVISYHIPKKSELSIRIFDIREKEIMKLFDGIQESGNYSKEIDCKYLDKGLYCIIFKCNKEIQIVKFIKY